MKNKFSLLLLCLTPTLAASIDVDDDINQALFTTQKSPAKKAPVKRRIARTPEERQQDELLMYLEETLAPLADQLNKFTQSPDSKKMLEDRAKEREQELKTLASKLKSQQQQRFGSSGGYRSPSRSSYTAPYSSSGYGRSGYSPSRSTPPYTPPHRDDVKSSSPEPIKSSPPSSAGSSALSSNPEEERKAQEKKAAAKKVEEAKKLRDEFAKTIKNIATALDVGWSAYDNLIKSRILDRIESLSDAYDKYDEAVQKLSDEERKHIKTISPEIKELLPHLVYASAYDILNDKKEAGLTDQTESCIIFFEKLKPKISRAAAQIEAYEEGIDYIIEKPGLIDPSTKKVKSGTHEAKKLDAIIARLGSNAKLTAAKP